MMLKIIKENISCKDTFKVECQKCKCKKVSLRVEYARFEYESDTYYITCKHCGQTVSFYMNGL